MGVRNLLLLSGVGLVSGAVVEHVWSLWKARGASNASNGSVNWQAHYKDWREMVWEIGKALDKPDGVSALEWARKIKVEHQLQKTTLLNVDRVLGKPEGEDSVEWAKKVMAEKRISTPKASTTNYHAIDGLKHYEKYVRSVEVDKKKSTDVLSRLKQDSAKAVATEEGVLREAVETTIAARVVAPVEPSKLSLIELAEQNMRAAGKSDAWMRVYLENIAKAVEKADEAEVHQAMADAAALVKAKTQRETKAFLDEAAEAMAKGVKSEEINPYEDPEVSPKASPSFYVEVVEVESCIGGCF